MAISKQAYGAKCTWNSCLRRASWSGLKAVRGRFSSGPSFAAASPPDPDPAFRFTFRHRGPGKGELGLENGVQRWEFETLFSSYALSVILCVLPEVLTSNLPRSLLWPDGQKFQRLLPSQCT